MAQMYLIRRENRLFLGPMSLEEFREGLRKMNFGLQDEVAGNCGKWVVLDNEELIRKNYPELVSIISAELPVSWREMTGHAKQFTKKEQKVVKTSQSSDRTSRKSSRDIEAYSKKRKQRVNFVFYGSLFIAGLAVLGGIYLKTRDDAAPPVADIATLAQKSDASDFLNEMGLRLLPIVNKINKGKDPQGLWLPYLRMYAFYTNGSIDNLSMRTLRGSIPSGAPQDCSVEAWKKRWRDNASQTIGWLNGKSLVRNPWTKILMWDPHWVRRRPVKGWLKPRNWFEGCLMSASVAIRSISNEPNFGADPGVVALDSIVAVSRRLQSQIEMIQAGRTSFSSDSVTVTGVLTCMDQADNASGLQRCRPKANDASLQLSLDDHANWQWVRLALISGTTGTVDPALSTDIAAGLGKMTAEDVMSKLDFGAELRFLQLLQQSGGKLDGIVERVGGEFSDVHLRP